MKAFLIEIFGEVTAGCAAVILDREVCPRPPRQGVPDERRGHWSLSADAERAAAVTEGGVPFPGSREVIWGQLWDGELWDTSRSCFLVFINKISEPCAGAAFQPL